MKIGSLELDGRVILAPLAGIGNLPFRKLCRRYGAALVASEMLSCHGLLRAQPNTLRMLVSDPEEHPLAFQLFGAVPDVMAKAAVRLVEAGADVVDLNFGCPVPKVVRHKGGAALMKEPELLQSIVAACVRHCPAPVTVKIRAGWDTQSVNAVEVAKRVEDAGAAAIAVHARTRSQKFEGKAQWDVIKEVKDSVAIPVVGNGDVFSGPDAKAMLEQTGCDAVMIGRGALGRPWIFAQVNRFLLTGELEPEPPLAERVPVMREHYAGLKAVKGERTARLEMRKHTAWYLKGLAGAAEVRRQVNTCETEQAYLAILDRLAEGTLS